ncbi:hypothetical protein MKC66_00315 [[Clostridium] innocuum]|nr:hypothetical protein [[Clostridium] innocuum]
MVNDLINEIINLRDNEKIYGVLWWFKRLDDCNFYDNRKKKIIPDYLKFKIISNGFFISRK